MNTCHPDPGALCCYYSGLKEHLCFLGKLWEGKCFSSIHVRISSAFMSISWSGSCKERKIKGAADWSLSSPLRIFHSSTQLWDDIFIENVHVLLESWNPQGFRQKAPKYVCIFLTKCGFLLSKRKKKKPNYCHCSLHSKLLEFSSLQCFLFSLPLGLKDEGARARSPPCMVTQAVSCSPTEDAGVTFSLSHEKQHPQNCLNAEKLRLS